MIVIIISYIIIIVIFIIISFSILKSTKIMIFMVYFITITIEKWHNCYNYYYIIYYLLLCFIVFYCVLLKIKFIYLIDLTKIIY